jgi:hypothetical protein
MMVKADVAFAAKPTSNCSASVAIDLSWLLPEQGVLTMGSS